MIAKNGIDYEAMGFVVYGECPEYKGMFNRKNMSKERNISFLPSYKIWSRLIQIDKGNANQRGNLCEEWKEFENFEKWYNDNFYQIVGETMELSDKFFDINNDTYSPDKCCFLPQTINRTVSRLGVSEFKIPNIEHESKKNTEYYKIRSNNTIIATSDSKEEIMEIREAILKTEFFYYAEKNKEVLPYYIYERMSNFRLEV